VQCDNKDEGGDEYKVKGAYDANNQTYTPSVRQGNHVVHFVDVGKKNYTFQVFTHLGQVVRNNTDRLHSPIASVPA
jgi:hypothetical protein